MTQAQPKSERLLRLPHVLDRVRVSRSDWYRRIARGEAPKPIALGPKIRAWKESEIDAYIAQLGERKAA